MSEKMSRPTAVAGPESAFTPSLPVGASVPALAGDWTAIWSSSVSRTKSVVPVAIASSLFVYAAPAIPTAVVLGVTPRR